MKKTNLFILPLLIIFSIFISGAGEKVKTIELGSSSSSKKVLIAAAQSGFKDTVLNKAIVALQKEGCYIKVIPLPDLKKQEALHNYKAILVVNTLKIGSLEGPAKSFIKEAGLNEKIVLFTTIGDPGWKKTLAEKYDVATVTSASDMAKTAAITEELLVKIKARL